jgi:hypothetical protein
MIDIDSCDIGQRVPGYCCNENMFANPTQTHVGVVAFLSIPCWAQIRDLGDRTWPRLVATSLHAPTDMLFLFAILQLLEAQQYLTSPVHQYS